MATKEQLQKEITDANQNYGWSYPVSENHRELQKTGAEVRNRINEESNERSPDTIARPPVSETQTPQPKTPSGDPKVEIKNLQVTLPEKKVVKSFPANKVLEAFEEEGYESLYIPAAKVPKGAVLERSVNAVNFQFIAGYTNKRVPKRFVPSLLLEARGYVTEDEAKKDPEFLPEVARLEEEDRKAREISQGIMTTAGAVNVEKEDVKIYS